VILLKNGEVIVVKINIVFKLSYVEHFTASAKSVLLLRLPVLYIIMMGLRPEVAICRTVVANINRYV